MKLVAALKSVWHGWMRVSHAIGFVMSKILLTVLWFTLFAVYALITKAAVAIKKSPSQSGWRTPHMEESTLTDPF